MFIIENIILFLIATLRPCAASTQQAAPRLQVLPGKHLSSFFTSPSPASISPTHLCTYQQQHPGPTQEAPPTFFHISLTSKHFTHAPLHLPAAAPRYHLSPFFTSPSPASTLPTHLCTNQQQHPGPNRKHLSPFFTTSSPASTLPTHLCTYQKETITQVQTPHAKSPQNQLHVKKGETCHPAPSANISHQTIT